MEVWILYGDDIESSADLAHEVRRFKAEAEAMGITLTVYKPADFGSNGSVKNGITNITPRVWKSFWEK